jgi:arylsulfatase A-like enzyme
LRTCGHKYHTKQKAYRFMPPNIIFILIDDLGWADLSCMGSTFYETPTLDRLAAAGMRFTDAYAACPVCSPTRASLMTGRYPATLGITDWIDHERIIHPARGKLVDVPYLDHLPHSETTIATLLRQAGYATWHVGKWHLGRHSHYPETHGFDVNIGGCEKGSPGKAGFFSPYAIPTLPNGPDGEYLTDRLTDEAIGLIEQRDPDKPFFLNLWHYAVHTPIQAKAAEIEKYRAKAQRLGLDQLPTFAEGDPFPTEHKGHLRISRRLLQSDPTYAAMIENLDWNIGRLLQAVADQGLTEETVVIFTSDNGGLATAEGSPTCNAPLAEGKGWMYEGGTREPLLVKWPGVIKPGSVCPIPVTSPDFCPTLLEIAGQELRPDRHCDGVSFVGLLRGEPAVNREAIFWHYPHYGNQGGTPGSSVRAGDYKLIEFFEDGRLELYNLRQDIGEEHNLADQEPAMTAHLHQLLLDWRASVEAKIPQRNPL